MATLRTLDRRLRRVTERLVVAVEDLTSDIAEEIGRALVPATPVDTGAARANWRPSLNAPAVVPVTRTDPVGSATISRIAVVARQFQIGDTIYIVNNLPYIENLNEGSSPQAAAGFVQRSVSEGTRVAVARRAGGLL